ncbi:E3 ubiquitin-protein ligase PPP1R11 [Geodia barretti]|uniref:E3 ubiquitin-protein ligase PPP1R11 n=1 Tax=Geodia barretti TaxID=519541 RepID=A0AA35TFV3_GEOBA|nr:E3 ubiquitin-protein ligase PPP1R11 [Geodia barretti]
MACVMYPGGQPGQVVETPYSGETLVLRLSKPKSGKKVHWGEDIVDNEHMGKKKSKCCCIYEKPRGPDDGSDSESDSEDKDCCHEHRVARAKVPRKQD